MLSGHYLLNFTGALFGVRQHGGVGWGEILQLPTPRSSFSSIKTQSRVAPPRRHMRRAGEVRRYQIHNCNPRSTADGHLRALTGCQEGHRPPAKVLPFAGVKSRGDEV